MDLGAPIVDGVVHAAYDNPRPEVQALVPAAARRILDVGCSTGALAAGLRRADRHLSGIESEPRLAALARQRLDAVLEVDVEVLAAADTPLKGAPFDCIVAADVLEHLRDPWAVVAWLDRQLAPGGSMVVSVPNIRHARTFWKLLVRKRWPYEPVGIFDRTHLRWFARNNLDELMASSTLHITTVTRTYQVAREWSSKWNRLAPLLRDFGTLQWVFRAERPTTSQEHAR